MSGSQQAQARQFHEQARKRSTAARRFLKGAYALVASLFVAGYAAAYLPPGWFWWTGLVAVTVPYASLLLVALLPLAWRGFRRRGRLLHGALLLLAALRFLSPVQFAPRPQPGPHDLVLMSFNAPVRGPNPEALAAATVALVERERPDVLALQEPALWLKGKPPRHRVTAHLQALLDSLGYLAPKPPIDGAPTQIEQPVLTRAPLDEVRQIVLAGAQGTEAPSYVLRAVFRWQGRKAVLYNLHLHTVGEPKPWHDRRPRPFDPRYWVPYLRTYRAAYQRRAWEVEQLRRLLARETLPAIVAGDCNSTMHHWEYRQLARGLQDAFTVRGQGWGATYHARLPLVRIDHILVGPAWEVLSAHVPAAHAFSDHRAVVARLRWRR